MVILHSIAHIAQHEGAGHFYNYHRAVQKALEQQGHKVVVYLPLNANFEEMPKGWKRWFTPFYNRKTRRKFWCDCKNLFRQPTEGPRVFFLEHFSRRDFFLYSCAALLFARKTDTLWTLYRDDFASRRKDLTVIRWVSKCLQWRFGKRFVPLTDSELLADYYKTWFFKRPTVLPVLYAPPLHFAPKNGERLICAWVGAPRSEKGAADIARLVQLPDPAATRIELEVSGAAYFPTIKNKIQVTLRKALLNEEEYYSSLKRCDVILLPYDPQKYRMRTSGIFIEAILAGKIPLAKRGSWLSYELNRFGLEELIVDWHNPLFFTHLFSIVQNEAVIQKLTVMQKSYIAFHGEENFSQTLLAEVNKIRVP